MDLLPDVYVRNGLLEIIFDCLHLQEIYNWYHGEGHNCTLGYWLLNRSVVCQIAGCFRAIADDDDHYSDHNYHNDHNDNVDDHYGDDDGWKVWLLRPGLKCIPAPSLKHATGDLDHNCHGDEEDTSDLTPIMSKYVYLSIFKFPPWNMQLSMTSITFMKIMMWGGGI